MNLEAWLANLGVIERLGVIGLCLLLLGAAIYYIVMTARREHARAEKERTDYRKMMERRLSLIEEENRDCHTVLTAALSTVAELLVLLKQSTGGKRQNPDLQDIEVKFDAIRETLRENKKKYEGWARDEAKQRDKQ